jgi:hypothetical protein
MSHRTANRFNQREVSRAVRAVAETGAAVDRVEIDPTSGKISVILAKPGGAKTAIPSWDEVLTNAPDAKRTT